MNTLSDTELGALLLARARCAIARHLGVSDAPLPDQPELEALGATFVTLTNAGELRGCIGSVYARRTIAEDVAFNAIAAATRDTRFTPVTASELPHIRVEVSLLSEPHKLDFRDEATLLKKLRPGVDGVMLYAGAHSATFLPQVWEQLREPRQFLDALKRKAGLDPSQSAIDLHVATYTVRKWTE
ncbi:MAG: AmmeMemoRadiSam system protein A [Rhodocyclales bacterium]|nr:AmmeMemoRadiSam system protein A [Rhodocyclales bacterium]